MSGGRARVARQGAWALGGSSFTLLVNTGITACLARWLAPEAFGTMAVLAMLGNLTLVLSQLGLGAALVQAERVERPDSAAILGLSLLLGSALTGAAVASGPLLAPLFGTEQLPGLLSVYALTLLIGAPAGVAFALLQRELQFGLMARLQVASVLLYGALAVGLAGAGAGVWALVLGRVVSDAVILVPALILARVPLPRLDWTRSRRFLRFGGSVAVTQLLLGVGANIDTAIVGAALGVAALGHYNLAFALVMVPAARLASVVKRVAFAALSRSAPGDAAFESHGASLLLHMGVLCTPLVLGLAYVAPDAIALLLGPGWGECALLIALLAPAGVVSALGSGMGAIVLARGHAQVELGFAALRVAVMGGMIAAGVWWAGARGAALGVSLYNVLGFPLFYLVLKRWGGMRSAAIHRAIAPGIVAALGMAGPVLGVRLVLAEAPLLLRLGAAAVAGAGVYALLLRMLFPAAWQEVRGTLAGLLERNAPRIPAPEARAAEAEGRA